MFNSWIERSNRCPYSLADHLISYSIYPPPREHRIIFLRRSISTNVLIYLTALDALVNIIMYVFYQSVINSLVLTQSYGTHDLSSLAHKSAYLYWNLPSVRLTVPNIYQWCNSIPYLILYAFHRTTNPIYRTYIKRNGEGKSITEKWRGIHNIVHMHPSLMNIQETAF